MSDTSDLNEMELWDLTSSGSPREKAEAYRELASRKLGEGQFPDACVCAVQGAAAYRELSDTAGEADCLYYAGRSELLQKNHADALAHFERAAELQRSNPNEYPLAIIVNQQGDCYKELGQPRLAWQCYDNAAKLYASCDNGFHAANSETEAAEVLLEMGENEEAELAVQQALDYATESENNYSVARVLIVRGKALAAQGNSEAALAAFSEARAISKYVDHPFMRHNILREYGCVLAEQGRTPALAGVLRELREITQAHRDAECQAIADYLEALAGYYDGDFATSLEVLDSAIPMLRYIKDLKWAVKALELRGRIYILIEADGQAALTAYEEARALAKQKGVSIAESMFFMGHGEALARCNRHEDALALLDELPIKPALSALEVSVFDEMRAFSLKRLYRDEEAVAVAQQVIEVQSRGNFTGIPHARAHETLGRAQLGLGMVEEAKAALTRSVLFYSMNEETERAKEVSGLLLDLETPLPENG